MDQNEYQKRYNGLTAWFDKAKVRLDTISSEISDKQSRQARIEVFLADIQKQDGLMEKFDPVLWYSLLDFVMVYSRDDIRFTFKDGIKVKE